MPSWLSNILSLEFMPHGHCYYWSPQIIWLHLISDSLIAAAYYSIPVALVYFVKKRQDLAFNWMFVLFAVFILACGTTHLMEIWNIWHGAYVVSGVVKLITALASIPTAVLLWPLIPKALKLPSPAALEQVNRSLAFEVAERRRAEEEVREFNATLETKVREATAQLQHESQLKDDFLATLSHELRTPLNAILGWARLIKVRKNPEEVEKGVQIIEKNTRAQAQLIEDLLEMSRITAGKVRLDVRKIDLAAVAQSAIASIEPAAEAKGIKLTYLIDPSAGEVLGDADKLQQVFWNILTNAMKFTPKGGEVQVFLRKLDSKLEFEVIDSGIGIKPDFLPYVFDKFRQDNSSSKRRFGGLGLGLSIVKQLVELHGGSVSAKSQGEGQGTTITVTLPVPPAETDLPVAGRQIGPRIPSHQELTSTEEISLGKLKILVVDDEPDSRDVIKRILEAHSACVYTAGGVDDAYKTLCSENIDVLVSDIGMPDKDGFDLIRLLRASQDPALRRIPGIALTAFARTEDRTRAAVAGYNSHLAKPVEPLELVAVVANLGALVKHRPEPA